MFQNACNLEQHSGYNIAKALRGIASDFQIESIPCLVTDNAANMAVAATEAGLAHTGCFAHILQLGVEKGLKLNTVSKALGAARKVVPFFNRPVLATKALNDKQLSEDPNCKPKKVMQDSMMRWNSYNFMMQRLLELRFRFTTKRLLKYPTEATWTLRIAIGKSLSRWCQY